MSNLGLPLSKAPAQNGCMRNRYYDNAAPPHDELIASFGGAQIRKHLDGRLEIRGGTESERTQARDWIERFLTPAPLPLNRVH